MTALLTESAHDLMLRLNEEEKQYIGRKLMRQVVRIHVSGTDVLAVMVLKAWRGVRETLEGEGFEGRQLAHQGKLLLDAIDWIMPAYERFLAQAKECGLTPEAARLPDLEAKLPALQQARPKIVEILEQATQPPRPVDDEMLKKSKGALERGEFVTLDDEYLARLRAGQDF